MMPDLYENNLDPMDQATLGSNRQDVETGNGIDKAYSSDNFTTNSNRPQIGSEIPTDPSLGDRQEIPGDPNYRHSGTFDNGPSDKRMKIMKVAFDPATDQHDAQTLSDATEAADALSKMTPEQQQEAWPRIASGLIQDNPKAATMIKVDQVPTQDQLNSLLRKDGKSPFDVKQDGNPASTTKEAVPEGTKEFTYQNLDKVNMSRVQDKIIEADNSLSDLDEIKKNYNPKDFTFRRQGTAVVSKYDEKLEINALSPEQHQESADHNSQMNRIKRLMLQYRKLMTGVAGGPQEMDRIENSTLNPYMSASQARTEMASLQHKYLRDRMAYRNLLTRGVMADNMNSKDYTNLFTAERAKVEADNKQYMRDLRAKYPEYKGKINEDFALQHKSYWDKQKFQQHMQKQQGGVNLGQPQQAEEQP